jgi:hypothetical protein
MRIDISRDGRKRSRKCPEYKDKIKRNDLSHPIFHFVGLSHPIAQPHTKNEYRFSHTLF